MNLSGEIKKNIHLYVILELAIKSLQHDQKLFESFRFKRVYKSICDQQLTLLDEEFKDITRALLKQGVKFEKYQCINKGECIYYFLCRGESIQLSYNGDILKDQVERKMNLSWRKGAESA